MMPNDNTIRVLDYGFVRLKAVLGSDITVANAARVSFGKQKETIDEADKKLIGYLAKNRHWSPFRHVYYQFHIKAPEFVMRQHYKHVVGCAYTSLDMTNDHGWNELSLRYVKAGELDFYYPEKFRKQSEDNKQGSSDEILKDKDAAQAQAHYFSAVETAKQSYDALIDLGVAKEQARCVIPLSVYTELWWTASLQAVFNYLVLRKNPHAQFEIREYAGAIEQFVQTHTPVAYKALMEAQ